MTTRRLIGRAIVGLLAVIVVFAAYVVWINRPLPQTRHDVAIVKRARELLADEANWNRHDDRDCAPTDETLSLYCALERASMEIAGEFRHRAASLQAVRHAIDAKRPDRDYAHRLMDFNNDPEVNLEDVHEVLALALDELTAGTDARVR